MATISKLPEVGILRGPWVWLEPLALRHVAALEIPARDASLWTWWIREPPVTRVALEKQIRTFLDERESGLRQPFAIFCRKRRSYVGSTSLTSFDAENRSVEIGSTWLASSVQGSGLNACCKQLLLRYAFEELQVIRTRLETDVLNLRSRRAIEKIGGVFEGVARHDRIVWNGRARSSAKYSILAEEWRCQSHG